MITHSTSLSSESVFRITMFDIPVPIIVSGHRPILDGELQDILPLLCVSLQCLTNEPAAFKSVTCTGERPGSSLAKSLARISAQTALMGHTHVGWCARAPLFQCLFYFDALHDLALTNGRSGSWTRAFRPGRPSSHWMPSG